MNMENVVAFNNELSGLYDSKPPISKAKMGSITKSAMRAIKFYKHVVQSVEKFILKCKPEYKIPGLYVIDSIVRQSRHQFGPEKDVFAPRFARNLTETFVNLFRCSPEDKGRIVRVLNLWQKNNVFAPDVIQPIFDLADPSHPIYQMSANASAGGAGGVVGGNISGMVGHGGPVASSISLADISTTSNGLSTSGITGLDMNVGGIMGGGSNVDDKLSGMPDLSNNNLKQLLNDPNVLRQLQTLQNFQKFKQQEENQKHKMNEMRMQDEAFEKRLQIVLKSTGIPPFMGDNADLSKDVEFVSEQQSIEVINLDGNDSRSPTPDRDRYKRRRNSRSRTRSPRDRGGRRRRSTRSRSRSRSPRSNRRRSSRERDRERMESRSNRDKEREHERERRKKGLPDIKKEHLSVCSTTLWVGHLSKLVYQEELSDTFGEYGDIVSIDLIVPRGCAFIVMNRRQDAYKAMQALKNHKLQGRAITISWAAGKGVKSKEWKDYWDLELGVTYIPWNKIDENTDLDSLEEGGMFDEDTLPNWMRDKFKIKNRNKLNEVNTAAASGPTGVATTNAVLSTTVPPPTGAPTGILFGIDTTQPPPNAAPQNPTAGPPPPMMGMGIPGQFSMAPPMSGPPHRMLGPMGPMNPMTGMPIAPNLVPGMPPPHPMMVPPGMLPPGFPAIAGPVGPPGPMAMGLPPNAQFPPPSLPNAAVVPATNHQPTNLNSGSLSNDDQMDIEMELEDVPITASAQQQQQQTHQQQQQQTPAVAQQQTPNFNQPPPMFGAPVATVTAAAAAANNSTDNSNDPFSRERQRNTAIAGGGSNAATGASRWGGRNAEDENNDAGQRWRDNNTPAGGPMPNFNVRNPGAMNINPMEINIQQQRPDFMNDFDNRGPPRGAILSGGMGGLQRNGGGSGGDFFPPNRFNQPTSLMQMRIPPPAAFNQRMVGPANNNLGPMFVRNQGGVGSAAAGGGLGSGITGVPGGRQGFFNARNPFNDNRGGRGGRGPPGGGLGGRRGPNSWSDDEDEGGNNFKRRGGPIGNRFRDRDDERFGGRGGPRGRNDRNRNERDVNERERDRERSRDRERERDRHSRNRRISRDDNARNSSSSIEENITTGNNNSNRNNNTNNNNSKRRESKDNQKSNTLSGDTEEDWECELKEYESKNQKNQNKMQASRDNNASDTKDYALAQEQRQELMAFAKPVSTTANNNINCNNKNNNDDIKLNDNITQDKVQQQSSICRPLYDEPPPSAIATTLSEKPKILNVITIQSKPPLVSEASIITNVTETSTTATTTTETPTGTREAFSLTETSTIAVTATMLEAETSSA